MVSLASGEKRSLPRLEGPLSSACRVSFRASVAAALVSASGLLAITLRKVDTASDGAFWAAFR